MQYRTLGRTEDTLNVARADMRRTERVKANAATSDDPTAPIDLNDLFRRF